MLNTQNFLVFTELTSRPESLTARDAAPDSRAFGNGWVWL